MEIMDISKVLSGNAYPGRGIILGRSKDGTKNIIAYFIMGRSENSRNRIFEVDGEGIKTKAFDESKLTDPSLIIYSPVRVDGETTVVTNGDQTDTVYDYIIKGDTFENALRTRTFEPDPPNFTPRISGIINKDGYKLSILKSAMGDENSVQRFFYEYQQPQNGIGHFIHTYKCDGNPIPSFEGEPEVIALDKNIDDFTKLLWDNLNEQNKVSLFVRYIDIKTNDTETRIVNKNQ